MSDPSFSVVIPTFNRAELVMRTIESVRSQSCPAHEIIVVDNCSTDDTVAVLTPLIGRGEITFVQHPENRERAASRNTGLDTASGDFVTFLDSDDLMYRDNLAAAAAYVRGHPEAALFHNLYEHVAADGTVLRRGRFPAIEDARGAIADGNFMSCIGNFVGRRLYRELRFDVDPELSGSEDWLYWLQAIARAELGRISSFNSGVVHHPGQTMAALELAAARRRMALLLARVQHDPVLAEAYRGYIDRLKAGCLLFLASTANTVGDRAEARRLLRAALRSYPPAARTDRFARILARALLRR